MNQMLSKCHQKAPGHHLAVLHRLSTAFLSPRMAQLGIKRGWVGILLEVIERPGQPQDALCRRLKVDRAAAARTLFELERQGYVTRHEDAGDRRQKLVEPTTKTLEMADGLFAVLKEHNQALFKGFDQQRREEALDILKAMNANLEEAISQEGL